MVLKLQPLVIYNYKLTKLGMEDQEEKRDIFLLKRDKPSKPSKLEEDEEGDEEIEEEGDSFELQEAMKSNRRKEIIEK